jgi:hypothetical protein
VLDAKILILMPQEQFKFNFLILGYNTNDAIATTREVEFEVVILA